MWSLVIPRWHLLIMRYRNAKLLSCDKVQYLNMCYPVKWLFSEHKRLSSCIETYDSFLDYSTCFSVVYVTSLPGPQMSDLPWQSETFSPTYISRMLEVHMVLVHCMPEKEGTVDEIITFYVKWLLLFYTVMYMYSH